MVLVVVLLFNCTNLKSCKLTNLMEVLLLLYWAITLQQWIRQKSEKWPRMLETQKSCTSVATC